MSEEKKVKNLSESFHVCLLMEKGNKNRKKIAVTVTALLAFISLGKKSLKIDNMHVVEIFWRFFSS